MKRRVLAAAAAVLALGAGGIALAAPASAANVGRIDGSDRYETAVKLAQQANPSAKNVMIVSGANFADALSAGPFAAEEGAVLLLTDPGSLPASVSAYLASQQPTSITIVGGPAAVSANVQTQLGSYSKSVGRIYGADRFETSRKIVDAQLTADPSADSVVLATGVTFPDALAAGVAQAPVLLVNGGQTGLDEDTSALLDGADLSDIYIAGGDVAVSAGIEDDADAIAPTTRLAGEDRFSTAVAIDDEFVNPDNQGTAFLVSGANFPDALAVSAYAAYLGQQTGGLPPSPIVLTQPNCMPTTSYDYLRVGSDTEVSWYPVGGTVAISEAAANATTVCK